MNENSVNQGFEEDLKGWSGAHFMKNLGKHLSAGLCITDMQGTIVECNNLFAHILGYTSAELKGRNFSKLLPEKIRKYALMLHQEYLSEKINENAAQWPWISKEGQTLMVQTITSRLITPAGRRYKMEIISLPEEHGQDLENLQRQVAKQEEKLRDMSHRFKNLLMEIEGLMQLHANALSKESSGRKQLLRAQNRIKAVAMAYQQAYQLRDDLLLETYLTPLIKLWQFAPPSPVPSLSLEEIYLPVDTAYTLAIVLAELLYCYRSRYENTQPGLEIKVEKAHLLVRFYGEHEEETLVLDDFGNRIIQALLRQLKAGFELEMQDRLLCRISLPL
ncbi:MAG: PAS domain S-box protein [Cyclobacteriaceae bacterium]